MAKRKIRISVVIPLYNEQENIKRLYVKLASVLKNTGRNYEIIFVDDGSTDNSLNNLKELQRNDRKVEIISFRKNYGQTAALSAGFDTACGEIVVTLDADMQNDPKDIPALIKKLEEGYDVVSGWRRNRKDPYVTRVVPSRLANWMISKVSGVDLHDFGCTLKAYKKEVVKEVKLYGEMHRFIPVIAAMDGASISEIEVSHRSRKYGRSKYGMGRISKVMLDLFTVKFFLTYQTRPIHLFGKIGLFLGTVGGSIFAWLLIGRLFLNQPLSERPLFLISVLMILVSIQLITTGILAEVLVRTFFEVKKKPQYSVRDKI